MHPIWKEELTDIAYNGRTDMPAVFVLTGGGALMRGLDKRISEVTGLSVRVADDPARATIRGLSVVLDELDFLAKAKKR